MYNEILKSPARILTLGFIMVILLGTFLLELPVSYTRHVDLIDNLFISTSAVCVTGLVTINFSNQYTLFGKDEDLKKFRTLY